jgi:hypothetical protein
MSICSKLLIPYDELTLLSSLREDEIRKRFLKSVKTSRAFLLRYITYTQWEAYYGRETPDGFRLTRALFWGNTYRPYFWVALIPGEGGTILSVKCFGYGVIGAVIALVFVILVLGVMHGEWTFVLYFVLGLVVMHVLCWFAYQSEKNHVVRWPSDLIRV